MRAIGTQVCNWRGTRWCSIASVDRASIRAVERGFSIRSGSAEGSETKNRPVARQSTPTPSTEARTSALRVRISTGSRIPVLQARRPDFRGWVDRALVLAEAPVLELHGLADPLVGLRLALFHACALGVHERKLLRGLPVASRRSLLEQRDRFGRSARRALPLAVGLREIKQPRQVAAVRGFLIPAERLLEILPEPRFLRALEDHFLGEEIEGAIAGFAVAPHAQRDPPALAPADGIEEPRLAERCRRLAVHLDDQIVHAKARRAGR